MQRVTAVTLCVAVLLGFGVMARSNVYEVPIFLLGVVRLAGTDAALSPEQTARLLPLVQQWQQRLGLNPMVGWSSNLARMQAVLTSMQIVRIEAMHLTSTDVMEWTDSNPSVRVRLLSRITAKPPSDSQPPSGGTPLDGPPPGGGTYGPSTTSFVWSHRDSMMSFADSVISLLRTWATGG